MREKLLNIKLNLFIIIILTIIAGMAGHYYLDNRWLGLIFVGLPLCAFYCWQQYTKIDEANKKIKTKHKNKYR